MPSIQSIHHPQSKQLIINQSANADVENLEDQPNSIHPAAVNPLNEVSQSTKSVLKATNQSALTQPRRTVAFNLAEPNSDEDTPEPMVYSSEGEATDKVHDDNDGDPEDELIIRSSFGSRIDDLILA